MLGIISILVGLIPGLGPLLTRPRLRVSRAYRDSRIIRGEGDSSSEAAFAHVRFTNEPLLPWLVDTRPATHLQARISFYQPSNPRPLVGPLIARWGDADQPASLSPYTSTLDIEQITLPPNGAPRELDIAIKHAGESDCYGVDNTSFSHAGLKRPGYGLPCGKWLVQVDLVADNFGGFRKWFSLSNGSSEAAELGIEEINPPKWHRQARAKLL